MVLKIEGRAYRLIHYSRSADRMLGRWIETVEGKELNPQVAIHKERLASLCQARGIKRLAVFGSALRVEFGPESDIDVLVEFEEGRTPGLLGISRLERELSSSFGDRKVDLRTPEDLSRYFRRRVMEEAEVQYGHR